MAAMSKTCSSPLLGAGPPERVDGLRRRRRTSGAVMQKSGASRSREFAPGGGAPGSANRALPRLVCAAAPPPTASPPHRMPKLPQSSLISNMESMVNGIKQRVLTSIVDYLFKPSNEVNVYFQGNFAPVQESGGRLSIEIIEGSLPKHFPHGVYMRNGPNPQFGADILTSTFGRSLLHWFEGDGMIHATYFGPNGQISYQNKYIQTKGYISEKQRDRRLWLPTFEGDPNALGMGYFLNQLQFGKVNKPTCNTSVLQHAARVFVAAEGDLPHEIDPTTLNTLRVWNWNGAWDRPVTAHPKIINATGEMQIFGFSPEKPYLLTGIVSSDGQRIIHKCDLGLERCVFSHDIGITKQYTLILDFPLTIDVERLKQGGDLLYFDANTYARVGIMPRFGDMGTIRWFDVQPGFMFHIINSYEDGDEVVLHGCRARGSFVPPKPGMDKMEWFSRALTPTKIDDAVDPTIDGTIFAHAHEWRFNMRTGGVVEKDITDDSFSVEMPRINELYSGCKNKYAYANVADLEASKLMGMPKYGKLVKLYLNEQVEDNLVKHEFYDPGPNKYLSEPLYIQNPNSQIEDDGWIITYVHDEISDTSEVHILAAAADQFNGKPLVRMSLPQRVPYGFHSTFVHGDF